MAFTFSVLQSISQHKYAKPNASDESKCLSELESIAVRIEIELIQIQSLGANVSEIGRKRMVELMSCFELFLQTLEKQNQSKSSADEFEAEINEIASVLKTFPEPPSAQTSNEEEEYELISEFHDLTTVVIPSALQAHCELTRLKSVPVSQLSENESKRKEELQRFFKNLDKTADMIFEPERFKSYNVEQECRNMLTQLKSIQTKS